ncbi:PAS domain-containing protein [Candidatus Saccharibacteria bacterium]|jgi:signal transduction histidine kinase|nr:PAS domain-containing protein [Candidatus Saccharibacteria bacterium]
MIDLLKPLKERLWLNGALLSFGLSILAVAGYVVVNQYLPNSMVIGTVILFLIIFSCSLFLAKILANSAIKPVDFLARAVLTVTNEQNNIEPPLVDNLDKPSKEFLSSLINKIYSFKNSELSTSSSSDLNYYKTITSLFPLPIIAVNARQEVTFLNEAALKYLELNPEQVSSKSLNDIFNISFTSTSTLENWIKSVPENAVSATETWQRVRLNLPDNKTKKFDLVARYSQNDSNGIELVLAIYDRTLLYERDDRDLTFVALAVHELRTPVTILRGYIEVFGDELGPKLDSEQASFMHNMSASAQQLTSFVSNILNVARIEENALSLNLKEENWKELLTQVCKDMDLRAKVHGKKLVVNIADGLPTVAVDRVNIYEVIANLIENAIKYTHTDEEIVIDSHMKDGMVETSVTDRGVGIPSNIIEHIFDKFYRSHSSKNSVGGTGLGLFLSKAIVEAHSGQISVKSKEKEGSTFSFTLMPYENLEEELKNSESGEIVRGAHGWIKNHSLYRG